MKSCDEIIRRGNALDALCKFCSHECDVERHGEQNGFGCRCAQWYAINSIEAIKPVNAKLTCADMHK